MAPKGLKVSIFAFFGDGNVTARHSDRSNISRKFIKVFSKV